MDFTKLKAFMDFMARERTPGNAVAVYVNNEKVFSYTAGYSDLENQIPLTGDELYNLYSCSKVTTVTAGAQLLEQGKILLSDPLYDYMPEFRRMNVRMEDGTVKEAQRPITVGDLFSMTAGFDYDFGRECFQKARELTNGTMDTVQTFRCLAEEPLAFEPGSRWQYSMCHDVLAALISVVSGKKFREYVRENIFEPLDMQDACYHHTPETLRRTAEQYRFIPDGEATVDIVTAQQRGTKSTGHFKNVGKENSHVLGPEFDSGGAGVICSVMDYAKLASALACGGVGPSGERILSPYTIDLMRTNRLNEVQLTQFRWEQLRGCGYGLGVRTHMDPAASGLVCSLGEFGWGGAAGASIISDPKTGLGVFYAQHTLSPREEYYQPRLRNVVYTCL